MIAVNKNPFICLALWFITKHTVPQASNYNSRRHWPNFKLLWIRRV